MDFRSDRLKAPDRIGAWITCACLLGLAAPAGAGEVVLEGIVPSPPPACVPATSTFVGTSGNIPDNNTLTRNINVTGLGPAIWDVNVTTMITHPDLDEIDMTLQSPGGTIVVLTKDKMKSPTTLWDDQAGEVNPPGPLGQTPADTTYVPDGALAAFVGENPNGVWTLRVTDDEAAETGQLNGWEIDITTVDAPFASRDNTADTGVLNASIPANLGVASALAAPPRATFVCGVELVTNLDTLSGASGTIGSEGLEVYLTSPAGTEVTISAGHSFRIAQDDGVTTWSDDATQQVVNPPNPSQPSNPNFPMGPLVPEEAMGAFNGEDPTGEWVLTIVNNTASATRILKQWSLAFTTCSCLSSAGICPGAPNAECSQPVKPGKAKLLIQNRDGESRKFKLSLKSLPAIGLADLGQPTSSTDYSVCVYDDAGGDPLLVQEISLPAGNDWREKGKGFKYKTSTGQVKAKLKSGDEGKAKMKVSGKGSFLGNPELPLSESPGVAAQVINTDRACWGTEFSAPAKRNDEDQYKAKGE